MKFVLVMVVFLFSIVFAEKLLSRFLRSEWTKSGMIASMSPAKPMSIQGAKAAFSNNLEYIGNKKNLIGFGISFVAFQDAKVANSTGFSYQGQPKDVGEFANASGALMGYLTGACLGVTEQNTQDFAQLLMGALSEAQKTGKPVTVQRQFGVFSVYLGNVTVKPPLVSYSIVISSKGVLGKAGWVTYCSPKQ
jgi:hypothetical protein